MIDRRDFADVTTKAQAGALQSFWPIVIRTNNIPLQTEIEINISPCDALWCPTVYDISCGANIAQPYAVASEVYSNPPGGSTIPPYFMPDPTIQPRVGIGPYNYTAAVGANICDVYQDDYLVQAAAVFSIRINSPNNPWLLFGLSTMIPTRYAGGTGYYPEGMYPAGQGGCMRSITGPISRLWVKFYRFATWYELPTTEGQSTPPVTADPAGVSNLVLMSSLGFMQQTVERVQTRDTRLTPPLVAAWSQTIASGGYQIPQLNSADKLFLGVKE
jgi:hypothetical protein